MSTPQTSSIPQSPLQPPAQPQSPATSGPPPVAPPKPTNTQINVNVPYVFPAEYLRVFIERGTTAFGILKQLLISFGYQFSAQLNEGDKLADSLDVLEKDVQKVNVNYDNETQLFIFPSSIEVTQNFTASPQVIMNLDSYRLTRDKDGVWKGLWNWDAGYHMLKYNAENYNQSGAKAKGAFAENCYYYFCEMNPNSWYKNQQVKLENTKKLADEVGTGELDTLNVGNTRAQLVQDVYNYDGAGNQLDADGKPTYDLKYQELLEPQTAVARFDKITQFQQQMSSRYNTFQSQIFPGLAGQQIQGSRYGQTKLF